MYLGPIQTNSVFHGNFPVDFLTKTSCSFVFNPDDFVLQWSCPRGSSRCPAHPEFVQKGFGSSVIQSPIFNTQICSKSWCYCFLNDKTHLDMLSWACSGFCRVLFKALWTFALLRYKKKQLVAKFVVVCCEIDQRFSQIYQYRTQIHFLRQSDTI